VARRMPKGQETRERILTAALDLFGSRGYGAITIDDIALAAGVTKGAVYYWFTDKDDLGRELQHELYERLTAKSLLALDPDGDAVTNMRRGFDTYLAELGELGAARFFLRDAWVIPALEQSGRRDREDAVALVRGILTAGTERGEIVDLDPDILARVLLGVWAEATLQVLRTGEREQATAVITHFVESLRAHAHSEARP